MKDTTDPRLTKLAEALEMRSARPNTRATYLRCAANVTALLRQARVSKALGTVLSGSDVERLLAAVTSLKYRAIVMTAYGAGLRIGEVLALEVSDIDSKRMLIRVKDGKTGGRFSVMGACWLSCASTGSSTAPRGRCCSQAGASTRRSLAPPSARRSRKWSRRCCPVTACTALAAARFCHSPARCRDRSAHRPGAARTCAS